MFVLPESAGLRPSARLELCDHFQPLHVPSPELDYAVDVAAWLDCHLNLIAAKDYARLLADRGLPVELLDSLPCQRTAEGFAVWISPQEWEEILDDASTHADDDAELIAAIEIGLRVSLQRLGVDLAKAFGPRFAELLLALDDAPDFIREAQHLTIAEQVAVHHFRTEAEPELVLEAKRMAVEQLRRRRDPTVDDPGDPSAPTPDVTTLLAECVEALEYQAAAAKCVLLPSDRECLCEFVLNHIQQDRAIEDAQVDGRTLRDVLMDEADTLSKEMLAYIRSLMMPV
jgi:hypothetical protein